MVGFCILASPMQLQMHLVDMIRDMGLYAISVILLVVIFNDERITTIESWCAVPRQNARCDAHLRPTLQCLCPFRDAPPHIIQCTTFCY